MAAIETRALRKVYPLPPAGKRRGPAAPGGAPGMPGAQSAGRPQANGGGAAGIVALDALDLAVDDG